MTAERPPISIRDKFLLLWPSPVTNIDTPPQTCRRSEQRCEPAPRHGHSFLELLRRRPSGDVLCLTGGQALLAIGQVAGVRFLTEAVPPDMYGTVSVFLGLVVLGRSL